AYDQMLGDNQIQQFGGNVAQITMVSPVGTPETGPAANVRVTPTFQWDASSVTGTVGSYLIHIEEITEAMVTGGGEPTSAMILIIDPLFVTTDPVTGVKSFTLGSGEEDITTAFMTTFGTEVPFTTALTGLSATGAYSWGVLAFADDAATVQATITGGSKPEPIGDSFEPMMFATGTLPSFLAAPPTVLKAVGNGAMATAPKVKVGNKVYFAIPSNIAPNFYGR
ncbi:MAG: hypothetical protein HY760_02225, partial [Nitrospirae bacterium]|nr:hypothetical protein [Nitrospirota bacterium]